MENPQAGWYPDTSGDATKLRYWDGNQWTDNYMDAPQGTVENTTTPNAGAQYAATYQTQPPAPGATGAAATTPGAAGASTPNSTQQPYAQPGQPVYAQPVYVQPNAPAYEMDKDDQTLRLIAFIFALLSTISVCWLLIPLAWMIPMTVMTYQIYKGKRPNTTAFGVLSLIFLSLVSGILLLVSNKNE